MENARKIKLFGDRPEAMRKFGDGQALLRATKAISELLGLPYHRLFSADKSVMAQSIPGVQDQIILSHEPEVPIEEEKKPYCSIALLNLPEAIPPMKWYVPGLETFTKVDGTWIIKDPNGVVEVEGVDYLKTYYRLNITDCNECSPFISTVCKTDELTLARCHPFTYDATKLLYMGSPVPYFQGWPDRVPPVPPDPKNHLIHSFYESGQAEILRFGSDSQGSYFLWKAYTEWGAYPPMSTIFSRTGLGYLLLKAFIRLEGMELCQTQSIVKVDCCLKIANLRKVEIWWEGIAGSCTGFGEWFMNYKGTDICKMPTSLASSDLFFYTSIHPFQPFYSIPEIKGSCLPMEWELSGTINFRGQSKKSDYTIWTIWAGYVDCHDEANIILRDRCGTEYKVRGVPCCENPSPLVINYTSLSMPCGGYQSFSSSGGCGPVTWSATPGSIDQEGVYHAADTNPGCHVEITVTDCCGNIASINLAVSCAPNNYIAFAYAQGGMDSTCSWNSSWGMWMRTNVWAIKEYFRCDNTPWGLSKCCVPGDCVSTQDFVLFGQLSSCQDWTPCLGLCWWDPCGTTDRRTEAQIQDGCCPIDFETGLPM